MIPESLLKLTNHSLAAVADHPHQDLRPIYRFRIYEQFGSVATPRGRSGRGYLAIFAAQAVLPIWRAQWSHDVRGDRLINFGLGVLAGYQEGCNAIAAATSAWEWIVSSSGERVEVVPPRALWALGGCAKAVFTACGEDYFDEYDEQDFAEDTENDLDPDSADAALWASMALAGGIWEKASDSAQRRRFWSLWLQEMVPRAWEEAEGKE